MCDHLKAAFEHRDFRHLWDNPVASDVVIEFDDGDVHGHSIVLARTSDFFKDLLFNNPIIVPGDENGKTVLDMKGHHRLFMRIVYGFFTLGDSEPLPEVIDAIGLEHKYDVKHIADHLSQKLWKGGWGQEGFLKAWPYWDVMELNEKYGSYISGCLSAFSFEALSTQKNEIMEAWTRMVGNHMETLLQFLVYLWEKTDLTQFAIKQLDYLNRSTTKFNIHWTEELQDILSACNTKSDEFHLKLMLIFMQDQADDLVTSRGTTTDVHSLIGEVAFSTCIEVIEEKISDKKWSPLAGLKKRKRYTGE